LATPATHTAAIVEESVEHLVDIGALQVYDE
jgi:hypothetical protein